MTQTHTIRYYDAGTETMIEHEGRTVRSGNGYSDGVEYGVLYHLSDGRYLGGVRHHDHGDLLTGIRYASTAKQAMPDRWR